MKGEFFRPCPKCGRLCNSELDMCEICSGKIAKPEPPKPIIPVVTPVVEPIVEEVAPIVEEQVATEEVIEEVTTEENTVEETTNEEKQEEVVAPVIKTKAPKGKGAKGLYALVAVLMLIIVALVVVIVQDKQPDIAVNNTTLQSNTTNSTTLKQETEITTEITEGTTTENAGETLAPVTTTKKAQNTNKETTTKKNTSSTTKKITTTTTEASEVEFNPTIVYSKDDVYRISIGTADDYYLADVRVENIRKEGNGTMENPTRIHLTTTILKIYKEEYDYDLGETVLQEISKLEFSQIKHRDVFSYDFVLYGYNESGELYSKESIELWCEEGEKFKPGYSFEGDGYVSDDEIDNIVKYCLICK